MAAICSPGSLDWATEKGISARTDRTREDIMVFGLYDGLKREEVRLVLTRTDQDLSAEFNSIANNAKA